MEATRATAPSSSDTPPGWRERMSTPGFALLAICFTQALVLLDTTVVNIAFHTIEQGLDASLDQILWVTNSYLLTYAVLLVLGGRLGDLFGTRRVLLIGLVVFTVTSAACGLAQTPGQLILGRGLQGIGAALLAAQAMAVITRVFPAEQRGRAMGTWGAFAGLATAVGPTVGGLLADTLGWRAIFVINVPVGVVGFVLVMLSVPPLRGEGRARLDLLGSVVLAVAIFLLVYPLVEGERHHWGTLWGPVTVPGCLAAGLVVLGAFVLVQRRRQGRDPLIPFGLVRNRNFALLSLVIGAIPGAVAAVLLLVPLYLQTVRHWSPFGAGLVLAVPPLISVVVARRSGRLVDAVGGKTVLIVGLLLFAAGVAGQVPALSEHSSWLLLLPGLVVMGVGMGVCFAPSVAVAMQDVPSELAGVASGVFNTTRLCGSLLCTALTGALFQVGLARGDFSAAVRTTYLIPVLALLAGALLSGGLRRAPAKTAGS